MLIAYGDDSGDETQKRVFAAGVVVGRQEDWDFFLPKWIKKNPEGRPFHATDCDSDHGDFKNRSHEDNKQLYADNVGLFVNSQLMGAGVAISVADYWELFPFAPDNKWWPYYLCFSGALACVCEIAKLSIPQERIKVLFDRDEAKELDSTRIFDFIAKRSGEPTECLYGHIEFGNYRKDIGLQVADLIARETMKDLDNRIGPTPRWPRQSLMALRRSNRFATVCKDRASLQQYRASADLIHADPQKGKVFKEWLERNGGRDSIHMRLRFLAEGGIT